MKLMKDFFSVKSLFNRFLDRKMAIASTKKMIGFLRYASPQFKSTTSIAALDRPQPQHST